MKIRFVLKHLVFLFFLMFLGQPNFISGELTEGLPPEISELWDEARKMERPSRTGALILKKEAIVTVNESGHTRERIHLIIRVDDKKAASDYGQIVVPFNSHYGTVTLDFAKTYQQGGKILTVSEDALQIKTLPSLYGEKSYSDRRLLTFSPKGMAPGVIFEYMATIESDPVIEGGWSDSFYFNHLLWNMASQSATPRMDPVFKSRYILRIPSEKSFKFDLKNIDIKPEKNKLPGVSEFRFEAVGLPPLYMESNMPPLESLRPSIRLSSYNSWKDIDAWGWALFSPHSKPDKNVLRLTGEITSKIVDENKKIEAIFDFVQQHIEYTVADLGRGGYAPHSPGEVIKNRYGDCKDKTILLMAMLSAAGINSYPAFTDPFPFANTDKKIPSTDFSHVIVHIPGPSEELWLDATGLAPFPALPWQDQGRPAFVVDGKGGRFKTTPEYAPDHNWAKMKFAFFTENNKFQSELKMACKGAISENLKQLFRIMPDDQRRSTIRNWYKGLYPDYELQNIVFSDPSDPKTPLEISCSFENPNKMHDDVDFYPCDANFAVILGFFSDMYALVPPQERKNDYETSFGYVLEGEWLFRPPDKSFHVHQVPEEANFSSDMISYTMAARRNDENMLVHSSFSIEGKKVNGGDYEAFYGMIQRVIKDGKKRILYKKSRVDTRAAELRQEVESSPENTQGLLNLAKHYLKSGRYSEAKELMEKAVSMDGQNGELHYYLGVTLGYTNQADKAREQFEKAAALGYIP